jgi:hypothetical protein
MIEMFLYDLNHTNNSKQYVMHNIIYCHVIIIIYYEQVYYKDDPLALKFLQMQTFMSTYYVIIKHFDFVH